MAPAIQQDSRAGKQRDQRETQQKHPQGPHSPCIPLDHQLGCVRRFVWNRLKAANDQSSHEERGRGDEHEFGSGEEPEAHFYFMA